jgi:CP family cyanate transporter-like MFS transporter
MAAVAVDVRTRASSRVGSLIAIFIAAACMRSAITALGPLLHLIRDDTGLSDTELGLLSALPLLGFAGISAIVHGPSRRLGFERLVTIGLVVLAAGTVVRSLPALAPLWIGTALIGGGVAVCNVVLPSVVKRDFADHITLVTGLYTAIMGTFAALASGIALPVADAIGDGWRWSLGIWVIPTAIGALAWASRSRKPRAQPSVPARTSTSSRNVWRSPSAWTITVFMGLQSTTFYVFVSWLPSIATSHHISTGAAGWYLFGYQVCGLLAGLTMPAVTHRLGARLASTLCGLPVIVGAIGLFAAPGAFALWVVLAGGASGMTLVGALSLMSLESPDPGWAVRLSGMAQSGGYLIAAGGPIAAGWLHDTTGSWTPVLVLIAAIAALQSGVVMAGHMRRPAKAAAQPGV